MKAEWILIVVLFVHGCAPSSMEECRREGEALCRRFTQELQKITSREDLVRSLPKIKRYYEEIADLVIETQNLKKEHAGEAICPMEVPDALASEALMLELMRVYKIEGGRELMEGAHREALFRLDRAVKNF